MLDNAKQDLTSLHDERALRQFEAAWRAGRPEPLENYLPAETDSKYLPTLEELVHLELELGWKAKTTDEKPSVEGYLSRFPCLQQPDIVRRLVRQEYQWRVRAGAGADIADYRKRFPDLALDGEDLDPTYVQASKPAEALSEIPGYEILEVLGRGGMGLVVKARQLSLGRTVAIKQILSGAAASEHDLARFKNEAEAVARLQHPNIVQIYEVGEVQGRPFIVLEYLDGGNLSGKMAGTPFANSQAARLTATLARAVDAVHQKGILHRDLKPATVLLASDGTPKITDFGLAKQVERKGGSLTESGMIVGTPSYMSPEQAAGKSKLIGPPTDIYALGTILYEMLTGRPPFQGASAMETVGQVLSEEPVSPRRLRRELPRDLETICLKCLHKEPHRRYESALALAEDLERFLEGEPIKARPVGRGERLLRWCRRKPALASLSAALVLTAIGAVVGVFFWQQADHQRRQQALEFNLNKKQQDVRDREARRNRAQTQQDLARGEVKADRFASAVKFLREGLQAVQDDPELKDLKNDLDRQHDQLRRLVEFYQLSDKAERLAFFENDDNAMHLCEMGLKNLGIFEHRQDWWLHLPDGELNVEQREKVRRDAEHQLLLLAGMWVKEGITGSDKKTKPTPYDNALQVLDLLQRLHKDQKLPPLLTVQYLDNYCRYGVLGVARIQLQGLVEPRTASDCYFVGIAYFWSGQSQDEISQVVKPLLRGLGFDQERISSLSRQYLRRAAADGPKHYWTHFWLGWSLLQAKDYLAAEQAFTTCVTVRPDYALGYVERAMALANQYKETKDTSWRKELERRVQSDVKRALDLDPHDAIVQLIRTNVALLTDAQQECRDGLTRVVELVSPPHLATVRQRREQAGLLQSAERGLVETCTQWPDDFEMRSVLALARALLEKKEATQDAEKVLQSVASASNPARHRALIVRGFEALSRHALSKAAADFGEVLQHDPKNYRALAGRARVCEREKKWSTALEQYQSLRSLALTDWQRLEALLGETRTLRELNRPTEADAALEQAKMINLRAGELLERK